MLLIPACGRRAPALKHVILFIGDGMSAQTEVAASRYLTGRDDGLAWHKLPAKAFVATWDVNVYNAAARQAGRPPYSRSSFTPLLGYDVKKYGDRPRVGPGAFERFPTGPATDSASAATAMATGYKTDSGNISWLPGDPPDGGLKTIAEDIRDASGAAIGVVSTVPFDHATPAAFVSHNTEPERLLHRAQGLQGPGHRRRDRPADQARCRHRGRRIRFSTIPVSIRREATSRNRSTAPSRRRPNTCSWSGSPASTAARPSPRPRRPRPARAGSCSGSSAARAAISTSRGSMTRPGVPAIVPATDENPSLAEATLAALDYLGRDPDGFFLVVEQGDIDWANHDNDFEAMIGSVADLDGAVRAALAFVDRPGDGIDWANTVLIVTADHATGAFFSIPAGRSRPATCRTRRPGSNRPEPSAKSGSDRGPAAQRHESRGDQGSGIRLALRLSGRRGLLRNGGARQRARQPGRRRGGVARAHEAPGHVVPRPRPRQHPDQRGPAPGARPALSKSGT
ncbi:MAG: alkaline phosphatase [Comamonadaceae bacterium]|nr:alkaline phosphatase [Comamonadaceae bacterium]